MKRTLLILCLLGGVFLVLPAQLPTIRNFTNLDYHAGTQNWCIGQCVDQRMVFANNQGVLAFDGNSWAVYPMPNYTNVRSVYCDSVSGRVYVGATDEFGYFEGNPDNYQLVYHSYAQDLPEKYRRFGEVWKVHPFGEDMVFRLRDRFFVRHASGMINVVEVPYSIENSTVINHTLYISCKEAIYTYDGKALRPLPGSGALQGKSVRGIFPLNGRLIFVTADDGLWTYDGKVMVPFILDITPLLCQYQVYSAHVRGNFMAFGTVKNGLVVKDLSSNTNYFVNAASGLQNNTVLSLKFDEFNHIWLGLDNGISYVNIYAPYHQLLGKSNGIGTGYSSVVHQGALYMGTNQGLFFMSWPMANQVTPPTPQEVSGVAGQIWCTQVVDGTLLCGANEGAYVVHGATASRIEGLSGTWRFQPLHGHPGYVLACDYDGFVILKATSTGYVLQNRVAGFSESGGSFEQDDDGGIWLTQWQKGIYHFHLSADLQRAEGVELFDTHRGLLTDGGNFVTKIKGKIYISSVDGFRNYDRKTHQLVKNEAFNKVFNTYGQALRVEEMPNHDLWAMKQDFLAIARHQNDGTYDVDSVTYRGVLRRLQISLGHFSSPDSTHTIMNYDDGFIYLDNNFVADRHQTVVMIRSIVSTNNRDTLLFFNHPKQKVPRIVVPHSLNSLRFEFVSPEYRDASAIEYECFLENYDKQWGSKQSSDSKEYTHLSGGHYTFHVRAYNVMSGDVNETSIDIRVLSPWYDSWYAYLLYIIIIGAALYLLQRYLKQRAERELVRVKKEQERERKEQEREMREQQMRFQMEEEKREKELVKLRNQQLEVDLKQKSSELGDSTMNLVRKNDMLQEIDEEMVALSESVRREESKAAITRKIADIRRGIRNNMNDDGNWDKFRENFDLVYDNFMQKLRNNYPDLKKNDLKLCAYLRMGLSSKEIASLLNVSVRSIETARYRLRKKLGMDSGDNLLEFIQKLGVEE